MVIDTSELMAILLGEEEAQTFARSIAADPKRMISAFKADKTPAEPKQS
jgi:uncharacterized protein with PIN domain